MTFESYRTNAHEVESKKEKHPQHEMAVAILKASLRLIAGGNSSINQITHLHWLQYKDSLPQKTADLIHDAQVKSFQFSQEIQRVLREDLHMSEDQVEQAGFQALGELRDTYGLDV